MPDLTIESAECCATYWGDYDVPGSKPGVRYRVSLGDSTSCTCPAFEYAPFPGKTCKHIQRVEQEACLWHPQGCERGRTPATLAPRRLTRATVPNSACPLCGGPTVAVRIAV
jgi:hypothetical protein